MRLLRKAEAVIQWRSANLLVVIERCTNDHNYSAILRTAEALGLQRVWLVDRAAAKAPRAVTRGLSAEELEQKAKHKLFARNATEWLDIEEFSSTDNCIQALRQQGFAIWATDLSQAAVELTPAVLEETGRWPLPEKLAIVFGTEAVGVSQTMLDAADLRVYLPLRGFADSLNLSVATALIMHYILLLEPRFIGDLSQEERHRLRENWYPKLARQRLLTPREKKSRSKLVQALEACDRLQVKLDAGGKLTIEQEQKLRERYKVEQALADLDSATNLDQGGQAAVAEWIHNPPAPLTDLRRANEHRTSFVGKGTRKHHSEHWKGMVAVENYKTQATTSAFFRERANHQK